MERWLAWANRARQSPIILIQSRPALSNHRPAIIGMNFNPNFNSEAIFFFKVVKRKKKGKGLEWGGVCRERPNGKSTPRTISLDDSSRAASGVRRPADDESTAPATTQLRGGHRHTVLCVCVCVCVEYSLTVTTRPTAVKEKQVYSVAVRPVSLLADSQLGKAKKRPHLKATV